jgi:hypothetical protein
MVKKNIKDVAKGYLRFVEEKCKQEELYISVGYGKVEGCGDCGMVSKGETVCNEIGHKL